MPKQTRLPRIQRNPKRHINQHETTHKLDHQRILHWHKFRINIAPANRKLAAPVRSAHCETGQCTAESLPAEIEHHTWEGDHAREKGGEGYCGAYVAAAGRGEGVDEEGDEEEVGYSSEEGREEGEGVVDAGFGFGGFGFGGGVGCYPGGHESAHHATFVRLVFGSRVVVCRAWENYRRIPEERTSIDPN